MEPALAPLHRLRAPLYYQATSAFSLRWSRNRKNLAGHPATTAPGRTSFVTTAPAPTRAPAPMVTPARITAPLPIEAPLQTRVDTTFQSASVCGRPSAVARGSR